MRAKAGSFVIGLAAVVALPIVWRSATAGGYGPELEAVVAGQRAARDCAHAVLQLTGLIGVFAAAASVGRGRAAGGRSLGSRLWADVAAVLAWSWFVRFVLTEPNILTDGGSGYGRIWRQSSPGYVGLPAIIDLVFPDEPHLIWQMMQVPWVLASLAPAWLVLLARGLGAGRAVALWAGIALASLPLHAALYASDFELGAIASLQWGGLAAVACGRRLDRGELVLLGGTILAFTCWGRPEAVAVAAPFALLLWIDSARRRLGIAETAAFAIFLLSGVGAAANFLSFGVQSGAASVLRMKLPSELWVFLTIPEVVPVWLSIPAVTGFAVVCGAQRRIACLLAIGFAAGCSAILLGPVGGIDPTASYMEYFRYGTWALVWVVLAAAYGLDAMARWIAARSGGRLSTVVARGVLAACCVATPVWKRDYLARVYGPAAEEKPFREVLATLPQGCGVIVPDDDGPEDRARKGTIEIVRRYQYIAEEASAVGATRTDPRAVLGVSPALDAIRATDGLPTSPGVRNGCWYYFAGSYCFTGFAGTPSRSCGDFASAVELESAGEWTIRYIHHRLVSRPDLRDPPFYDDAQRLSLFRVVGVRRGASDNAAAQGRGSLATREN